VVCWSVVTQMAWSYDNALSGHSGGLVANGHVGGLVVTLLVW
jgi:hypothetical protein